MRKFYKNLDQNKRKDLYSKVLCLVRKKDCTRNSCHRDSLRNLFSDAVSKGKTLKKILDYLIDNGYPKSEEEIKKINSQIGWHRKAGRIKRNPAKLYSVQKYDAIKSTLSQKHNTLESVMDLRKISPGEFLNSILDINESIKINDENFSDKTKPKNIKTNDCHNNKSNYWVTWNEKKPDAATELIKLSRKEIFQKLGLGFNINDDEIRISKDKTIYLGLLFDIANEKEMKLFRPGWGDAKTYHYWESIKNKDDKHGYTKPIDMEKIHEQPEAVVKNKSIHMQLISYGSHVIV